MCKLALRWSTLTATVLVLFGSVEVTHADVIIFSKGFGIPESISQVPAGFGSLAGSFLIPDAATNAVMIVPPAGGPPTLFYQVEGALIRGGAFLPPGFGPQGSQGGKYAALTASDFGRVVTLDANAQPEFFTVGPPNPITMGFEGLIAPPGFGLFGGQLITTTQGLAGAVIAIDRDLTGFTPIVQDLAIGLFEGRAPGGIAFAPEGFGNVGGRLLLNSAGPVAGPTDGEPIVSIDFSLDGKVQITPFTTVPFEQGQLGLRHMAFAPSDFGDLGGLLFVSISGSRTGDGTRGDVVVIGGDGQEVTRLRLPEQFTKFDPRGLLFLDGGRLLISDTSDPIILVTASDFGPVAAVPEPASLTLLGLGTLGLLVCGRCCRVVRFPSAKSP